MKTVIGRLLFLSPIVLSGCVSCASDDGRIGIEIENQGEYYLSSGDFAVPNNASSPLPAHYAGSLISIKEESIEVYKRYEKETKIELGYDRQSKAYVYSNRFEDKVSASIKRMGEGEVEISFSGNFDPFFQEPRETDVSYSCFFSRQVVYPLKEGEYSISDIEYSKASSAVDLYGSGKWPSFIIDVQEFRFDGLFLDIIRENNSQTTLNYETRSGIFRSEGCYFAFSSKGLCLYGRENEDSPYAFLADISLRYEREVGKADSRRPLAPVNDSPEGQGKRLSDPKKLGTYRILSRRFITQEFACDNEDLRTVELDIGEKQWGEMDNPNIPIYISQNRIYAFGMPSMFNHNWSYPYYSWLYYDEEELRYRPYPFTSVLSYGKIDELEGGKLSLRIRHITNCPTGFGFYDWSEDILLLSRVS